MKCFVLLIVVLSVLDGDSEPTFGEFFDNFPQQMQHAWGTVLSVLRGPARPRRLGKIGRLKKLKEVATNTTKSTLPTYTYTGPYKAWYGNKTTVSNWGNRFSVNKFSKLNIPIFTSRRLDNLIPESFMKKINRKYGFPAITQKSVRTSYTDDNPTTLSLRHKVKIPIIFEPTYKSVNDWNNLQRPRFAEIHKVSSQATTAFVQILKFMYGGNVHIRTTTESTLRYLEQ